MLLILLNFCWGESGRISEEVEEICFVECSRSGQGLGWMSGCSVSVSQSCPLCHPSFPAVSRVAISCHAREVSPPSKKKKKKKEKCSFNPSFVLILGIFQNCWWPWRAALGQGHGAVSPPAKSDIVPSLLLAEDGGKKQIKLLEKGGKKSGQCGASWESRGHFWGEMKIVKSGSTARFCFSALQTHPRKSLHFRMLSEMFKLIYLFHPEGNVFLSWAVRGWRVKAAKVPFTASQGFLQMISMAFSK